MKILISMHVMFVHLFFDCCNGFFFFFFFFFHQNKVQTIRYLPSVQNQLLFLLFNLIVRENLNYSCILTKEKKKHIQLLSWLGFVFRPIIVKNFDWKNIIKKKNLSQDTCRHTQTKYICLVCCIILQVYFGNQF